MAQQHEQDVLRMLEDVMSAEKKDAEAILEHFHECRGLGIELLPPNINTSELSCVFEREKTLRLGFSAFGFREGPFLDDLLLERRKNGAFQSFQDFCERTATEEFPESFFPQSIKAGVFDCLEESRAKLLKGFERVLHAVRNAKAEKAANQISLFAMMPVDSQRQALSISLPEAEAWSEELRIDHEKDAMGFSFTEYLMQLEEDAQEHESVGESKHDHGVIHSNPSGETKKNEGDFSENPLNEVETGAEAHDAETDIGEPENQFPASQENEIPLQKEESSLRESDMPAYLEDVPLPEEHWGAEAFDETCLPPSCAESPSASGAAETSSERQVEHVAVPESVCVRLTLNSRSEEQLLQLRTLCEKYPGKSSLLLEVSDESENVLKVQAGHKYDVRDTEEFRKDIQELFGGAIVFSDAKSFRK